MHTTKTKVPPKTLYQLQALTLACLRLGGIEWRRHGIGLIQGYLHESKNAPEARLHIWHPSALRPGIQEHGDIHNHRFDLESTILVGSLKHRVMRFTANQYPADWDVYKCVHARKDTGARYEKCSLWSDIREHEPSARLSQEYTYTFNAGDSYQFNRGAFHQTIAQGLCITLVTKRNQADEQARIICRAGAKPVHAFDADDAFDFAPVLDDAITALESAVQV